MPKKRKTRKQKILIDHKRQVSHEAVPSVTSSDELHTRHEEQQIPQQGMTFSLSAATTEIKSAPKKPKATASTVTISTEEYGYLGIDLLKTAIVTSAIVITEIVIRILFRG